MLSKNPTVYTQPQTGLRVTWIQSRTMNEPSSATKKRRQVTVATFKKWQANVNVNTRCYHGCSVIQTKRTTEIGCGASSAESTNTMSRGRSTSRILTGSVRLTKAMDCPSGQHELSWPNCAVYTCILYNTLALLRYILY